MKTLKWPNFVSDLTCDVIGNTEVNETWFHSKNLPKLSNAALNLQLGPGSSFGDNRGGKKIDPSNLCYKKYTSRARVKVLW